MAKRKKSLLVKDHVVTNVVKFSFPHAYILHEISDREDGFSHRLAALGGLKGEWQNYNGFAELEIKGLPGKYFGCMDSWRSQFPEVFQITSGEELP